MTVSTIADWLDRLQGVRKSGSGHKALCPAHHDKNPSLSVTQGAGDKVLVTCFAGCTFEAIRDTLWPQGTGTGPRTPAALRDGPGPTPTAKAAREPRKLPFGPSRYGLPLPLRGRVRSLCLCAS